MKKTILCAAVFLTFASSCSSPKSAAVATVENVAKQETEQLVVSYLTRKLAPNHPQLAGLLGSAVASTAMSYILGSNGTNTGALSNLVASQFGVSPQAVTNHVNSSGSTLGSLASFLVQNTNPSTLTTLLSGLK
ncbi:MAG: hypothetical protein JST67_11355 [Bacteroidetes bacterium]|nr:hypothetical protein [Bacteroidota bacterium]